jgi:hypothetical protein
VQSWSFTDGNDVDAAKDKWLSKGKLSSLFNRTALARTEPDLHTAVPCIGKRNYRPKIVTLEPALFSQVQDLWAIANPTFRQLRERWRAALAARPRKRQHLGPAPAAATRLADWIPTSGPALTEEEKKLQSMSDKVQVNAHTTPATTDQTSLFAYKTTLFVYET